MFQGPAVQNHLCLVVCTRHNVTHCTQCSRLNEKKNLLLRSVCTTYSNTISSTTNPYHAEQSAEKQSNKVVVCFRDVWGCLYLSLRAFYLNTVTRLYKCHLTLLILWEENLKYLKPTPNLKILSHISVD